MRGSFLKGAVVGCVCAVLGGATVALAGSGVGGVFNLGVSNSVNAKTTLTGASPGLQLEVKNTSAAAGTSGLAVTSASAATTGVFTNSGGGPAGGFFVNAGVKPFTVNSTTKVGNLNADLLDGLDSAALQKRVSGTCAAGTAVRVVNNDGSVSCQAVGSGGGWSLTGNAGTLPGANFLGTSDAHDLVVKTNGSERVRVTQNGNVGIGTTNPVTKFEVDSQVRGILGVHTAATGIDPGVEGDTNSQDDWAVGVLGQVTSTSAGYYSAAVRGINASTSGSNGRGVWGSQAGGGTGVYGTSASGEGVFGDSTSGSGVRGESTGGIGVYGYSLGSTGLGVEGYCANCTGVRGISASKEGVHGTSTSSNGVHGQGVSGSGVLGESIDGVGVYGYSKYGSAGYFEGDVTVSGTLSKGAGAFKIDHPLHPASEYLQHSFVESPEMMNVYNGSIVTDGKGFATIKLPAYFQALNREFRYQLTPIGAQSWDARAGVWREIAHNRFTIRTDKPRVKVSWQVTGVRHDPYANAHRIRVIVPKTGAERGKYLHPDLYAEPEAKTIGLDRSPMRSAARGDR